jgi:hypothetical protein
MRRRTSESGGPDYIDSLRSDRRPLRSQNIFLNFAGRSFGQLFDERHTVRRFEVREVGARKLAQLALRIHSVRSARRLFFPREGDNPVFLPGLAGIRREGLLKARPIGRDVCIGVTDENVSPVE